MGKVQLIELIYGEGRSAARETTNTIIAETRKIPMSEAKKKKMRLAHEVFKVLDFFWFEVGE